MNTSYQAALQEFQKIIKQYDNIIFFGGAGVSTESGIPDLEVWMASITWNTIILLRQS